MIGKHGLRPWEEVAAQPGSDGGMREYDVRTLKAKNRREGAAGRYSRQPFLHCFLIALPIILLWIRKGS